MKTSISSNPKADTIHLKSILVPVDYSGPAQQALRYARCLAQTFGAELTVLNVVQTAVAPYPEATPYMDFTDAELEAAEKNIQALAEAEATGSLKIQTAIRTGLPAHEIVETAKERDCDLIVIATHGYTGWKHFCIGSTAERVVRTAPCPVFVVREKQHEFIS